MEAMPLKKKLQPPAHVLPTPVKISLEPKMAENFRAETSLPKTRMVLHAHLAHSVGE